MENDIWNPTHVVPAGGMKAWVEPNPKSPPTASLAGGLELEVIQRKGSWAYVYNGGELYGWVDDRLLERLPRFRPTHQVPPVGLRAWASPNPRTPVIASLVPGSLVQVVKRRGGWSKVMASNGWTGWVDHRLLEGGDPAAIAAAAGQDELPRLRLHSSRIGGLLGGIAAIVAAFMTWEPATSSLNAFDVSFSQLMSYTSSGSGPATGLLLILLGVLGAAAAFLPVPAWVPRTAGAAVLIMATAYLIQVLRLAYDLEAVGDYLDYVGAGPFVTLGAGIAPLIRLDRRAMPGPR